MYEGDKFLIPAGPFSINDFHDFCYHWGFVCKNKWDPDAANPSYEEEWELSGDDLFLNYVDDDIARFRFVVVGGHDDQGVVDDFAMSYPIVTKADMLATAKTAASHNDHVNNAFRMSIAFEEFDEAAFNAFKQYASPANDSLLRQAALEAMARRVWPQSKEFMMELRESDLDPKIREQATEILNRWPT